jgi:YgiT-type zinc finger domain-containing protein
MDPNQPEAPTCHQCGKSTFREDRVRSAFWHDERLVVIEDIPALVCNFCHEQLYDDSTVVLIDQMRGRGFPPEQAQSELRVPVFRLTRLPERKEER